MEMNVENIMDGIINMNPMAAVSDGSVPVTVSLAVTIVIGVLMCLFGLKLIRVWNVLIGLLAGAFIGLIASGALKLEDMTAVIVTAAAAIVLAVLGGIFKKFGVFVYSLFGIFSVAMGIIRPENWILIAVCGAIGLVVAIIAMLLFDPLVIIVTSVSGAASIGAAVVSLTGTGNAYIGFGVIAVAAIIGIVVQFSVRNHEITKKEVRHAKAIKEEISKEQEVEQLRGLLDDEEE